jgi:lipoic acid synthetase
MNHNLETVPRLYKEARPGSDYALQLELAARVQSRVPGRADQERPDGRVWARPTKRSCEVMRDMRAHGIDMLTIGQYLAPSSGHLPVRRYVHPDRFKAFEAKAYAMGFTHAAVGAMVRSSYHADAQADHALR